MTFTCPICKNVSFDISGHQVMPRECGFYEILQLAVDGNQNGYAACSRKCASLLLRRLMERTLEVKPTGVTSTTWKCERCKVVLPRHIYQNPKSHVETVPSTARLIHPYEWGTYHCFCSNDCLLKHLETPELADEMP